MSTENEVMQSLSEGWENVKKLVADAEIDVAKALSKGNKAALNRSKRTLRVLKKEVGAWLKLARTLGQKEKPAKEEKTES